MAQYTISSADLSTISRNLSTINSNIHSVDQDVNTVNSNVQVVFNEVEKLAQEFKDFVDYQKKANSKQQAHTELVRVRQEIKDKFGQYDVVRRTATGILQADDLGIVRQSTITNVTEELMITTPNYWLAPCLVALAAWINDKQDLADRAVREAIRRDDVKTSLFFSLVCRRADRKNASLRWAERYLSHQDEEKLDRETIVVLDAYASGLLGSDTEGVIIKQMNKWLEKLESKPGFVEKQQDQWSQAIELKKLPVNNESYTYLKKYSKTWPELQEILEGAYLHANILNYFTDIFNQKEYTQGIKQQLDEILNSLVTDFDSEEIPLRKEERYNQLVIDFFGDEDMAKKHMQVEENSFKETKDFTQLLTDSAMNPESSHASVATQKFAIALSKDWISNAYNDVVAKNRMRIPHEIEINVDSFNDKTVDGKDEKEIIERYDKLVENEKSAALSKVTLSLFPKLSLFAGIAIAILGALMAVGGSKILGIVIVIAGVMMTVNHFSKKKRVTEKRNQIEEEYNNKKTSGEQIVRATLAEIVDFRSEFNSKDSESAKVTDFLSQIAPDQYVKKLSDSNRRININA